MLIPWQRIAYYLGLALVEATPPALLLTLSGGDAWGALIGVVLAGGLADWIILRRLRPARQGPALALVGLLFALWVVRLQVAPGASPLDGWGAVIDTIFSVRDTRSGVAYLGLLTALYCFWRGTRLTLHDSLSLHRLFRTATIVLIMIIGFGFFGNGRSGASVPASTEVLSFFTVGLITIALASASEEREAELRRMGWRGLLTLVGAVLLVLVLGLLIGSLFGREAAQVIRMVWQGLVLIIGLMLAPLLYLMALFLEWLLRVAHLDQLLSSLTQPPQQPGEQQTGATEVLAIFPPWVQTALRIFFALLPIALIIGLFLLSRRRARRGAGADEERESIWSWSGLAADLLGLLSQLGGPKQPGGLREALARLRGGDPDSRIRRSYIRLLLLGETRSQPRAAPQTPREYASTAGALLPDAAQPIDSLTDAYERARYHPSAATPADADAAEQAWGAIEQADRGAKRET